MNRAELRRAEEEKKKQTKVYTLTQGQINDMKRDIINEAQRRAVDQAFIIMLAIPLEVLITEEYWKKSAKKKIPKFIEDVLHIYKAYSVGDLTIEELADDLKEFGGVTVDPIRGIIPIKKED